MRRSICFPGEIPNDPVLMRHEAQHVIQQYKLGMPRFLVLYYAEMIWGLLKGKGMARAYLDISFEKEARVASGEEA